MRIFLLPLFFLYSITVYSQNVGIGTATPAARLHVTDSAVLFTGPANLPSSTYYAPPASGPGVRFMWYPEKAALRAGFVNGTFWDKDSIGIASIGLGFNTKAIGPYSTSLGTSTTASGSFSTSLGMSTTASGNWSTSMGFFTKAKSDYSLVVGIFNDTTATNRLFEVGNGTSDNLRKNAFTVLANGTTGIGTASPALASGGYGLHVLNSSYTQLRLQSNAASAGMEFSPLVGRNYELQADLSGNFFLFDRTANQYRLLVNQNGYLGIGMLIPTRPLSFPATLEKKVSFYPGATGDVGISVSGNDLRIYSDNVNARVSFGYDDYTTGFTSRAYVLATGTTAMVVQGNMTVNGTNYNSDVRFKQQIRPLLGALEKVTALQGVQYEMRVKEFPDRNFQPGTEIGLIAQDVEKVLPELVRTDADGYKSVDYAKLVPVLIEGMKAQQDKIRQQDEKMAQLLKRIEALEQQKER